MLAAVAYAPYAIAQAMLVHFHITGYHGVLRNGAFPTAFMVGLATAGLFAVCGFGATRLLLPEGLRRHELLWVLPVGACTSALGLTLLGFLAVPFKVSLGLVIAAGTVLAIVALRRRGLPARPPSIRAVVLPPYVAVLIVIVALIPLWHAGFATVIGDGSDAHLAAGTAEFLQHNYPTSTNTHYPVQYVPLAWRSKQPIYYALGAVSTLSGRVPYQALSTMTLVMLALGAIGFFLFARELLGAGTYAALGAMGVIALDRILIHTGTHPYFNQSWGYFTLPFALVLSWWAIAHRTRGGLALLVLFLALGAFAYPLALPVPVTALLVAWLVDRGARRRRGEPVASLSPRRLYTGRRRSLRWMAPLAFVLAVPVAGVLQKAISALGPALDRGYSLRYWGGDLFAFVPVNQYFGLSFTDAAQVVVLGVCACALLMLRRLPRPLGWGLAAVLLFGALGYAQFHTRWRGYYFEFKLMTFTVPVAIVCAVIALSRWRLVGPLLIAAYLFTAYKSTVQELTPVTNQLPRTLIALRGWDKALPPNQSIRLDMDPGQQLWVGYMLSDQQLCSQRPLFDTAYPRVSLARRAQYVLQLNELLRPADAVGAPVRRDDQFTLYRLRPGLPAGPETCSRARVQPVIGKSAL